MAFIMYLDSLALQADTAGFDCLLVGDSVGMVVHGHDTTLPVTVSDMLVHCRAVSRGAQRPFLIGDLPFGSYELSTTQAIETAIRFMKEGSMDAIKLEGIDCFQQHSLLHHPISPHPACLMLTQQ